ncbi:MAG: histidine kinase N-terminal 7TM domain-containing protein, partial [Verrucomicrobiota bacterium]
MINITLAVYVFWRRHSKAAHFAFAALAFVFGGWNFMNFMVAMAETRANVLFWGEWAFVLATGIGLFYVIFSWLFPETYHVPMPSKWLVCATVLTAGAVTGLCLTDLVQRDALPQGGHWKLVTGPLHAVFVAYMLVMFGWGTTNLLRSHARAPAGRERMQINYAITGLILTFVIGYLTNFVAPLVTPQKNIILLGAAGPVTWSLLTFYAIVRYRLLDIGIPLRASAIHGIVAAVLA